ncbi:hypothetical protein OIU84_000577 [Salix udensis]|uniref:Uncharacterized protein n=1 Tax=Salix udensis TaxID=889485 RepID=A0AAD6L571_9ROSI|nr:hypothetical protein OIU84_000577 [Salix udensis]
MSSKIEMGFPPFQSQPCTLNPGPMLTTEGSRKIAATCGPAEKENGRAKRTRSAVLEIQGEKDSSRCSCTFEEDFDVISDAESSCDQGLDAIDTALNDEECIDELFFP